MTVEGKTYDIAYFVAFCIEQYKVYSHTDGADVAELFDRYGVIAYLHDNFDVLHTQSSQWLMQEIDEYVKRKKKA